MFSAFTDNQPRGKILISKSGIQVERDNISIHIDICNKHQWTEKVLFPAKKSIKKWCFSTIAEGVVEVVILKQSK